jgi:hypothetical protein
MSSDPSQNQRIRQLLHQVTEELDANFNKQMQSLENDYNNLRLSDADRAINLRRQAQLLRQRIINLGRRARTLQSLITTTRANIAAIQSSDILDVRIVTLPSEAFQPLLLAHDILLYLVSLPAPLSGAMNQLMLNLVGAARAALPINQRSFATANASPPVSYGDPYDKLVGCGGGVPLQYDPGQPRCAECHQHHVQSPRPVPLMRAPGDRRNFTTLDNRALFYMRQARNLAHLGNTRAMDEEITFRILQYPQKWGDLGFVVKEHWKEMVDRDAFERTEQRDDQREMTDVWDGSERFNRLYPESGSDQRRRGRRRQRGEGIDRHYDTEDGVS